MERHKASAYEIIAVIFSILMGAVIAIIFLLKDGSLGGSALYWLLHIVIVAVLFVARYRFTIISKVALILAAYLVWFHFWLLFKAHLNSKVWLGYLFLFPGTAVGTFFSLSVVKKIKMQNAIGATFVYCAVA